MTTSGNVSRPTFQPTAKLVFPDGTSFEGIGIGATGVTSGEICFNTSMTGYQEILTDPSYSWQIITFTFPHIGNVGANSEDIESEKVHAKGLIVREIPTAPSNYRNTLSFDAWLKKHQVVGIAGLDTRAITRKIRKEGACNVVIYHAETGESYDDAKIQAAFQNAPSHEGLELAKLVSHTQPFETEDGLWQWDQGYVKPQTRTKRVVVIDYGCKNNIQRHLSDLGLEVHIVPGGSSYEDIMVYRPDGVLLSNGPGDPAATANYAATVIQQLIADKMPTFGICLGHQLLALSIGAKTIKMGQGHRGANHPVKHIPSGRVEITSQNHGFVVDEDTLPQHAEVTHRSLFDGTIEGIALTNAPAFSVQYHPESSPGPHDSHYLFQQFVTLLEQQHHTIEAVSNAKA